jgi:hypothetical protein
MHAPMIIAQKKRGVGDLLLLGRQKKMNKGQQQTKQLYTESDITNLLIQHYQGFFHSCKFFKFRNA